MRIIAALLITAFAAAAFFGCGGAPEAPEIPSATEAPEAEYELMDLIRYWPEDADYDSCDYAVIVRQPIFARTQTAGAAMNKAVDEYLEGLYERVESKYIPASIARPPYTRVTTEVIHFNGFTEVVFAEEHCYEAQPYIDTHVLLLDSRGEEVNLNDVYRTYHADTLLARAIFAKLSAEGKLPEGAELMSVMAKLDIKNGCSADENGITAYFTEGELAPLEYGRLTVTVPADCLLPEFVGGVMTKEQYSNAMLLTDKLCTACIVRAMEVNGGETPAYVATAFMGAAVQELGLTPEKGRLILSAERFGSIYMGCFGREFPGIDTDAFDIKLDDKGNYSVSASQKIYEYHLDVLEAEWQGDALVLTGDMVFGAYGYPFSTPVCRVTARLAPNAESIYGFTVLDFTLSN